MEIRKVVHHHLVYHSDATREVYFQGVASLCFKYLKTLPKAVCRLLMLMQTNRLAPPEKETRIVEQIGI
jgi:hypothetical protein